MADTGLGCASRCIPLKAGEGRCKPGNDEIPRALASAIPHGIVCDDSLIREESAAAAANASGALSVRSGDEADCDRSFAA